MKEILQRPRAFLIGCAALVLAVPALSFAAGNSTTVESAEAIGSSSSQVTVLSWFGGDDNRDGSVKVEYSTSSSFGSDTNTACEKATGGSPRVCYISRLDSSKTYYVRVTYTDPDGVSGSAVQTASATTKSSQEDIYPPTLSIIKPMDGGIVAGNSDYPVVIDFTVFDRHSEISTSSGEVQVFIDGAAYNASPNLDREGYYIFRWSTPVKGMHSVTAKARDKAGNTGYSPTVSFYVNSIKVNTDGIFAGDGKLLVRDNDNQLCMDCHGEIKPHSSQYLTPKYGNWSLTCRQCHTPHNTTNIFLVKEKIKTPNSGVKNVDFRVAISRDETTSDPGKNTSYSFTNKANPGSGPCEVCHTRTSNLDGTPRYRNTGTGPGPTGSHVNPPFATSPCIRCHDHKRGFSPMSPGGLACNICHPKQADPMSGSTLSYHMYLQNTEANALPGGIGKDNKYPVESQPSAESQHRRCIMCHADMDVFYPTNNADTQGIGYNLRTSVNIAPDGNNPATYTNTDFRGDLSEGGVCLSCHRSAQTKNNARKKNDGTTKTPPWDVQKFGDSAHNFTVENAFWSDSSSFKANCLKCHNDDLVKDFQRSQYKFGLHDTKNRSMLSNINSNLTYTETSNNSTEENFCFQCHSTSTDGPQNYNPNGSSGSAKDAYNVAPMKDRAVKIKDMFDASSKKSFHPISGGGPYASLNGLSSSAGKHKVDEYLSLPSGVQSANWNPANSRHVECTDCHNPHAASKEPRNLITWRPNPFDPTGGSFGGQVGGANKGAWGVEPTYDSSAWKEAVSYKVVESAENMYQLCFKCHSAYAYGAGSSYGIPAVAPSPPQIPMGTLSSSSSGGSSYGGSWGGGSGSWSWSAGPETDMVVEFNPNNYGFHPILRRGRNQPKPHLNSAWPYFNGGEGNGYGWQVSSSSSDRWGGGSYSSGSSSATPNGAGHVNFDAATKTVTIADGRDFPTYYLQPGWKIQFNTDRPSSSQTWHEIKTVNSAKQITLVSGPSSGLSSVTFVASAGLGWAFVPPYGPWSTITCADCHKPSDENDPLGPHGSDNPWLLRNVDTSAQVDNNLNGTTGDSEDAINAGVWGNPKMFCYSCHRRDVYGTKAAGGGAGHWGGWGGGDGGNEPSFNTGTVRHMNYSRLDEHPPFGSEITDRNVWGIWCMNCHGGDSLGGLHGSNKGTGSSSGSSWSGGGGSTPMGVRLRNGAAVKGHSISASGGSCSFGGTSLASCSASFSAGYSANYNYTGVD